MVEYTRGKAWFEAEASVQRNGRRCDTPTRGNSPVSRPRDAGTHSTERMAFEPDARIYDIREGYPVDPRYAERDARICSGGDGYPPVPLCVERGPRMYAGSEGFPRGVGRPAPTRRVGSARPAQLDRHISKPREAPVPNAEGRRYAPGQHNASYAGSAGARWQRDSHYKPDLQINAPAQRSAESDRALLGADSARPPPVPRDAQTTRAPIVSDGVPGRDARLAGDDEPPYAARDEAVPSASMPDEGQPPKAASNEPNSHACLRNERQPPQGAFGAPGAPGSVRDGGQHRRAANGRQREDDAEGADRREATGAQYFAGERTGARSEFRRQKWAGPGNNPSPPMPRTRSQRGRALPIQLTPSFASMRALCLAPDADAAAISPGGPEVRSNNSEATLVFDDGGPGAFRVEPIPQSARRRLAPRGYTEMEALNSIRRGELPRGMSEYDALFLIMQFRELPPGMSVAQARCVLDRYPEQPPNDALSQIASPNSPAPSAITSEVNLFPTTYTTFAEAHPISPPNHKTAWSSEKQDHADFVAEVVEEPLPPYKPPNIVPGDAFPTAKPSIRGSIGSSSVVEHGGLFAREHGSVLSAESPVRTSKFPKIQRPLHLVQTRKRAGLKRW